MECFSRDGGWLGAGWELARKLTGKLGIFLDRGFMSLSFVSVLVETSACLEADCDPLSRRLVFAFVSLFFLKPTLFTVAVG